MKKKWFVPAAATVMVVFTALMLILVYPHNAMPKSYTEAKDGVVFILSDFSSDGYISTGSGFAIGENGKPVQYIVTNYHVVFDDYGDKADSVTVFFSAAANRYMTAQIYRYDAYKDIAVLRLPETTTEVKPLKLCKSADNDMSGTFYALGYPSRATAGTDFERYDKTEIVTTSGMISRKTMIDEEDVYMLDLEITAGNSGGPLVNSKGQVVGINTFSITDGSGNESNYAVCIDELTRLVNVSEVPYTLTADVSVKGIIVIVATSVVDIILIVLIVVSLVGRKKQPASNPRPAKVSDSKSDYTVTTATQDIAPTVAVESASAVIAGIAGEYKGKDFEIDGKLVFGRDAKRCNVVLPIDAEGVSGFHCEVTVNGGRIFLKDLGSTYGTFINNGLKVDAGTAVEISVGDTFYLGSEKTKFAVKIR